MQKLIKIIEFFYSRSVNHPTVLSILEADTDLPSYVKIEDNYTKTRNYAIA